MKRECERPLQKRFELFENDSLIYLHNPLVNSYFTEEESSKFFNYMEFSERKSKEKKNVVKTIVNWRKQTIYYQNYCIEVLFLPIHYPLLSTIV